MAAAPRSLQRQEEGHDAKRHRNVISHDNGSADGSISMDPIAAWALLPEEVLQVIFRLMSSEEKGKTRLVHSHWGKQGLATIEQVTTRLRGTGREGSSPFPPSTSTSSCSIGATLPPDWPTKLPALRRVQLQGRGVTDAVVSSLRPLSALQTLRLPCCRTLTDAAPRSLQPLAPTLTQLHMWDCRALTDDGISALASLTELRRLELLSCPNLTDSGLLELSSLRKLRHLQVTGSLHITGPGLSLLLEPLSGSLTDLLNVSGCKSCSGDAGLRALSPLSKLTNLRLSNWSLATDQGFRALAPLVSLEALSVSGFPRLGGSAIRDLRHAAPCLRHLKLAECPHLTDASLGGLSSLSNLTRLDLSGGRQITDAALPRLAALSSLTHLDLSGCVKLTGSGLGTLRPLRLLSVLDLQSCQTLRQTEGLRLIASLKHLNINCTDIGDPELTGLASLTSLSTLKVSFCRRISPPAVQRLRAALLGATIENRQQVEHQ